ncbi:MAG: thiamine phosphate synthase, partial [Muribaculum sp.]|nr:thiamine phosphate synthase [Muribaculum sp.]
MIIYSTISTSPEAIKAQVESVINGGCKWVQISACGMSKDEMQACAEAIIPVCKENDTVLVLDRYVQLVDELRVHGVYLSAGSMNAAETREKLGPHAIIG